jgi:hypothetical protein
VSAEKLSPARLAEIAARAEAATPGPWAYVDEGDKGGNAWVVGEFYSIRTDDYPPLAGRVETHEYDEERGDFVQVTDYTRIICDSGMKHDDGPQIADAAFIAASRTDVPALLAHIAAVEAERDALAAKGVEHIHSFRYNCALLVHNGTGTSVEWQFLSICETCGEPRRLPIRDEEAPK